LPLGSKSDFDKSSAGFGIRRSDGGNMCNLLYLQVTMHSLNEVCFHFVTSAQNLSIFIQINWQIRQKHLIVLKFGVNVSLSAFLVHDGLKRVHLVLIDGTNVNFSP